MVNTKKLELIEELKELRIQKGMSYQQIADKTEENGEAVSLSSIKNVFSSSDKHDYDYNRTLRPIANALSPHSDDDNLEVKILQTRLDLKDEAINDLKLRIETKEQKHKDREQFYMNQIEHLQDEISFKNEQIRHHNEAMDRKDAYIKELHKMVLELKKEIKKEVFL